MNRIAIWILVLGVCGFLAGCNKDKEQIAKLEKEVKEAEARDYFHDSVAGQDTIAPDTSNKIAPAEVKNPDKTPDEYPEKSEMVSAMDEPRPQLEEKATQPASLDISPSVSKGGYTIQVASGTDRTWADGVIQKYIQRGYEPFISVTELNSVTYYRIRIGNFDRLIDAQKLGEELKDKFSANYWIDRNI
jgi:septal ring-binding cell division protein DamX